MECGETVFSRGVLDPAGSGVATLSADSRLDLSVVVVVGGCGGVLQFLVRARAWLWNIEMELMVTTSFHEEFMSVNFVAHHNHLGWD